MSPPIAIRGKVYLVGAGPGDPGLITLRGAECLAQADVVLYDYLVNPQILWHAKPGAELECLGRHGRDRVLPQDEINEQMIHLARQGRTVVRLKAGDPTVFARCADELTALREADIPFEIVPGITAAVATGSYAGIPLTHREVASAVALVTGQEGDEKSNSQLDFPALARFPGTLVFYMGVTTADRWTEALIEGGKPGETPVAIVRRCSWPDQQTILCTLAEVPRKLEQAKLRPPVVFVVGDVVDCADQFTWFTNRPLFGRTVLVTRPLDQAEELGYRLSGLGARCLLQPAIEIGPPDDWRPVDRAIEQIESFDWIVFSSANGVRFFLDRLLSLHRDLRVLGRAKLAAIGPRTAEELGRYHLRVDCQPAEYRAESLASELAGQGEQQRFLLVRASRGREVLAEELEAAGHEIQQVVCYLSRDVEHPNEDVAADLAAGRVDWITVTSSAIARSLVRLFGEDLRKSRLASISPVTSTTLRELGFEPSAEARQFTTEGVVEAIVAAESKL